MWSNDVNLANQMESSGRPGMVHISEKTRAFLRDEYFVDDGDPIKGKTQYSRDRSGIESGSDNILLFSMLLFEGW